jgi:hypothetical protein
MRLAAPIEELPDRRPDHPHATRGGQPLRHLLGRQQRHQKLKPGDIFVVRTSPVMWAHTGFVLAVNDDSFDTIEGNTGTDGGFDGANAKTLRRKFANIDFLHLQ